MYSRASWPSWRCAKMPNLVTLRAVLGCTGVSPGMPWSTHCFLNTAGQPWERLSKSNEGILHSCTLPSSDVTKIRNAFPATIPDTGENRRREFAGDSWFSQRGKPKSFLKLLWNLVCHSTRSPCFVSKNRLESCLLDDRYARPSTAASCPLLLLLLRVGWPWSCHVLSWSRPFSSNSTNLPSLVIANTECSWTVCTSVSTLGRKSSGTSKRVHSP
mmetsp:Transcript_5658/g.11225  ORF Transcript_5658/g.11225 Transcript_5658/m.11225 type:complete len:215 (-) Transcript_5658:930-1574(-)